MARPRTLEPRSLQHAMLGRAIELVIAEDADMTVDDVARDSGLDEGQIGNYMRGQGNPTYTNLLRLCAGLHVSLAELQLSAEGLHEEFLRTLALHMARLAGRPSRLGNDLVTRKRMKAAISLSDDTLRRVDRAAKQLGVPHYEFFARAAESWLAVHEEEVATR